MARRVSRAGKLGGWITARRLYHHLPLSTCTSPSKPSAQPDLATLCLHATVRHAGRIDAPGLWVRRAGRHADPGYTVMSVSHMPRRIYVSAITGNDPFILLTPAADSLCRTVLGTALSSLPTIAPGSFYHACVSCHSPRQIHAGAPVIACVTSWHCILCGAAVVTRSKIVTHRLISHDATTRLLFFFPPPPAAHERLSQYARPLQFRSRTYMTRRNASTCDQQCVSHEAEIKPQGLVC